MRGQQDKKQGIVSGFADSENISKDDTQNNDCGHEEEINILDNRISELTKEKDELKDIEMDYVNRLAAVTQQLEEEKRRTTEFQQKHDKAENKLLEQVKNESEEVLKLSEEITTLKSTLSGRNDEIASLNTNLSSLKELLKEKEIELSAKDELCGKNEQDLSNSKTVLDSLSSKLLEKTEECQKLVNKVKKKEIALNKLSEDYKSLKQLYEEKNECLINAEEALSGQERKLVAIEQNVDKSQQDSEEKNEHINKLQLLVVNLEKSLDDLRCESQNKVYEQKTICTKLDEVTTNLEKKEVECNSLKERLQNQRIENDALNQSLQSRETQFRCSLDSSKNEVRDLLEQLENEKSKYSDLNEALNTKEATEQGLNETVALLKQKMLDREKQIGELSEMRKSLELELTVLKERQIVIQKDFIVKEEAIQSFAGNENTLLEKVKSSDDLLKEQEKSLSEMRERIDCHLKERLALEEEINRLSKFESNANINQEKIEKFSRELEEMKAGRGNYIKLFCAILFFSMFRNKVIVDFSNPNIEMRQLLSCMLCAWFLVESSVRGGERQPHNNTVL